MNSTATAVLATAVLAALVWVDPIYLPLIGIGPLLTGAVAGALGARPRPVAAVWFAAGVITLAADLAVTGEDAAFHAVVAVVTAAVAAAATWAARAVRRRPAGAAR